MLDFVNEIVIFVVSSFKTKSLGWGKKSSIILIFPIELSEYLALRFFINFPPLSPIPALKKYHRFDFEVFMLIFESKNATKR
jgi:hypothetical protein